MNAAGSAKKCEAVAKLFGGISQYKDSEELKAQCLKKADDIKKEDIYNLALRQICGTIEGYECAIEQFKRIPGFKDADKKIIECREEIAKIKDGFRYCSKEWIKQNLELDSIKRDYFINVEKSGLFDIVDGYVLSYKEHQVKPYVAIYETLLNRYELMASECLFIDDNEKNIKTAQELGFITRKVLSDNYESVLESISEFL